MGGEWGGERGRKGGREVGREVVMVEKKGGRGEVWEGEGDLMEWGKVWKGMGIKKVLEWLERVMDREGKVGKEG